MARVLPWRERPRSRRRPATKKGPVQKAAEYLNLTRGIVGLTKGIGELAYQGGIPGMISDAVSGPESGADFMEATREQQRQLAAAGFTDPRTGREVPAMGIRTAGEMPELQSRGIRPQGAPVPTGAAHQPRPLPAAGAEFDKYRAVGGVGPPQIGGLPVGRPTEAPVQGAPQAAPSPQRDPGDLSVESVPSWKKLGAKGWVDALVELGADRELLMERISGDGFKGAVAGQPYTFEGISAEPKRRSVTSAQLGQAGISARQAGNEEEFVEFLADGFSHPGPTIDLKDATKNQKLYVEQVQAAQRKWDAKRMKAATSPPDLSGVTEFNQIIGAISDAESEQEVRALLSLAEATQGAESIRDSWAGRKSREMERVENLAYQRLKGFKDEERPIFDPKRLSSIGREDRTWNRRSRGGGGTPPAATYDWRELSRTLKGIKLPGSDAADVAELEAKGSELAASLGMSDAWGTDGLKAAAKEYDGAALTRDEANIEKYDTWLGSNRNKKAHIEEKTIAGVKIPAIGADGAPVDITSNLVTARRGALKRASAAVKQRRKSAGKVQKLTNIATEIAAAKAATWGAWPGLNKRRLALQKVIAQLRGGRRGRIPEERYDSLSSEIQAFKEEVRKTTAGE